MTVIVPVTLVAVVGAKATLSAIDWLGVRTVFAGTPVSVKPAPVIATLEIVTLEFPLLVRVVLNGLLLPTFTVPKLKLVKVAPSSLVAGAAEPVSAIVNGEVGALLVSKIEPLTAPEPVGVNKAEKVVLPPAATVAGTVRPEIVKPAPEAVAWEMVRLAVPLFFRVMVCEPFVPSTTVPKLTLVGSTEICG